MRLGTGLVRASATGVNARPCQALILSGHLMPTRKPESASILAGWRLCRRSGGPSTAHRQQWILREGRPVRTLINSLWKRRRWSCVSRSFRATQDESWSREAKRLEWFLGRNDLGLPVYDSSNGAGNDGLHQDRINENQGADRPGIPPLLAEMNHAERPWHLHPKRPYDSHHGPPRDNAPESARHHPPLHPFQRPTHHHHHRPRPRLTDERPHATWRLCSRFRLSALRRRIAVASELREGTPHLFTQRPFSRARKFSSAPSFLEVRAGIRRALQSVHRAASVRMACPRAVCDSS